MKWLLLTALLSRTFTMCLGRDWVDYTALSLTALLVLATAGTLVAIFYQAMKTADATEATEKSVRLQEVGLLQWVAIEKWECDCPSPFPTATNVPLKITFDVVNPTNMPLTLQSVGIEKRGGVEGFDIPANILLEPKKTHSIPLPIILTGDKIASYLRGELVLTIIGTIGYVDVFDDLREKSFVCMCICGPNGARFSPSDGKLPRQGRRKEIVGRSEACNAWVHMMRRLAREAVIFMLAGLFLAAVGSFTYLHHSEVKYIQSQRDALRMPCDQLTRPVRPAVDPPEGYDYFGSALSGPMVTRAECNLVFGTNLASLPAPTSFAPDFYNRRDAALAEGTRITNLKIDNLSNASVAAINGLYGFAGGFGTWLFYRLVRFAVKG